MPDQTVKEYALRILTELEALLTWGLESFLDNAAELLDALYGEMSQAQPDADRCARIWTIYIGTGERYELVCDRTRKILDADVQHGDSVRSLLLQGIVDGGREVTLWEVNPHKFNTAAEARLVHFARWDWGREFTRTELPAPEALQQLMTRLMDVTNSNIAEHHIEAEAARAKVYCRKYLPDDPVEVSESDEKPETESDTGKKVIRHRNLIEPDSPDLRDFISDVRKNRARIESGEITFLELAVKYRPDTEKAHNLVDQARRYVTDWPKRRRKPSDT